VNAVSLSLFRFWPALLSAVLLLAVCRSDPARRAVARVNGRALTVSELAATLPDRVDPMRNDSTVKRRYLEELIIKELVAQEAERRGLEEVTSHHEELGLKAFLIQELYRRVTAAGREVTPEGLDSAYGGLATELRLRLIEVAEESVARRVTAELAQGVPFESLAVRRSVLPNAASGGDLGWLPGVWLETPVRVLVEELEPGEHTPAVPVRDRWQFVKLEGRREADPPLPPLEQIRGELLVRLRQFRQQLLAREYQSQVRRRLEFVPEGIAVIIKPADSITPAEKEVPVAIRDGEKYVKVARLMHVLRRFPPALDSAMRCYAVERELEEDLMYEEALALGLDRLPSVRDSVARYRRRLLNQALYQRAVVESVKVSEAEIRDRFEANRDEFPGADFATAATQVEAGLLNERRDTAWRELVERLRSEAKITIDERVLRDIGQNPDGSWQ